MRGRLAGSILFLVVSSSLLGACGWWGTSQDLSAETSDWVEELGREPVVVAVPDDAMGGEVRLIDACVENSSDSRPPGVQREVTFVGDGTAVAAFYRSAAEDTGWTSTDERAVGSGSGTMQFTKEMESWSAALSIRLLPFREGIVEIDARISEPIVC